MSWIYNFRIRTVLLIVGLAIFGSLVISAVWTQISENNSKEMVHGEVEEVLPHMFNFIELKIDVIQIQQWLTDVSATRALPGFDDGFANAEKYYQDALKRTDFALAEHRKYGEAEIVAQLEEFKKDLDEYYKLGIFMAKAYIHEGAAAGNVQMEQLDPFAERLAEKLDLWVEEHEKEHADALSALEKHINDSTSVNLWMNVFLIVIIGLGFWLMSKILHSLLPLRKNISRLSALDMRNTIRVSGNNEISEIQRDLNSLTQSLNDVVCQVQQAAHSNAGLADNLGRSAERLQDQAQNSVNIIARSSDAVSGLTENMHTSVNQAEQGKSFMQNANKALLSSQKDIAGLTKDVQKTAESEEKLAAQMKDLSDKGTRVRMVLNSISDIAFQTNLLALNAAIEASRAGEHGKGFAVVAEEVRSLANRTQESLGDIDTIFGDILQAIESSSKEIIANSKSMQKLSQLSGEVNGAMNGMLGQMQESANLNDETVRSYAEAAQEVASIFRSVQSVEDISNSTLEALLQIRSEVDHLSQGSSQLTSLVQEFKVMDCAGVDGKNTPSQNLLAIS
jgi:methyl-accepting chemotaxis protein